MDCTTVNYHLQDYLDEMLDEENRSRIEAHLEACPECRDRLARERDLIEALGSLPEPALDPDFAARAFQKAAAAGKTRPRIATSIMTRIAASILVVIALGFLLKTTLGPVRPEGPEAFVRLNRPAEVKLVFYSEKNLKNVTMSLVPPEGVELVGFENQREIVWQTDLKQGENLLVLPVIARNREGGSLVARIRHGKRDKQFHLLLKVQQPNGPTPGIDKFESSVVPTRFI